MSVTIDDVTTAPDFVFKPGISDLVHAMCSEEFLVSRDDTYRWVHDGMRFLVCDEDYDSDDEESERPLPEAPKVHPVKLQLLFGKRGKWSLSKAAVNPEKPLFLNIGPSSSPTTTENGKSSGAFPVVDTDQEEMGSRPFPSCEICSRFRPFPINRKTTKFRLVHPAELFGQGMCEHFVAVSYRWMNGPKGSYTITTEAAATVDSPTRASRAPDSVIDRAVAHAAHSLVRFIWIDQECLPQPNLEARNLTPEEQHDFQLGVQSMDMVYSRAWTTAGLLTSVTVTQRHMEAIESILDPSWGCDTQKWVDSSGDLSSATGIFNDAIDFLRQVTEDPYHTRAWIFQEALCAGPNLSLLMIMEQSQKEEDAAPPTGDYTMSVNVLRQLVKSMDLIDQAKISPQNGSVWRELLSVKNSMYDSKYSASTPSGIIENAQRIHPDAPVLRHQAFSSIGSRQMCDAATALTFLKTRHCQEVADRVAIVANLCNYDVRLNTDMVAEHCPSLRLALWALSMMNNDLSLLAPDAFDVPQTAYIDSEWNIPNMTLLQSITLKFQFSQRPRSQP